MVINKKASNTLGFVSLGILAFGNLIHLFFTIRLIIEEIEMGWGYGTSMDIGTLWVWIAELITALPGIILATIYLCSSKKEEKDFKVLLTNIILLGFIVFQIIISNIFIFY